MLSGSKEHPIKQLLLELESHHLRFQDYLRTWNQKQEELLQGAWDVTQETHNKAVLETAETGKSLVSGENVPNGAISDEPQLAVMMNLQRKPTFFQEPQVQDDIDELPVSSMCPEGFFHSESLAESLALDSMTPQIGGACEGCSGDEATKLANNSRSNAHFLKDRFQQRLRMKSAVSHKAGPVSTHDLGALIERGRKRCSVSNLEIESTESEVATRKTKQRVHEQAERLQFTRKFHSGNSYLPEEKSIDQGGGWRIRPLLARTAGSNRFENLCAGIIFLNAIFIGLSADYSARNLEDRPPAWLQRVEFAFCCFYALEVGIRVAAQGRRYFIGPDWRWDWFDFLLAVVAAYDQVLHLLFPDAGAASVQNVSFLRMLRFLKMLRLLRMIRLMKVFRELRLILYAIFGCIQAMFWAVVMIGTISYVVGIVVLNACMNHLKSSATVKPTTEVQINRFWSSLGRAMLSLFQAATSGMNWQELAEPLEEVGWALYGLFVVYIAFFVFVIMNTFTSLFVETVMDCSERDQQMLIQLELEKKDEYIDKLQAFFDKIDDDQNGLITFEEFCAHADNPTIHAFAASLDIDITDAKQFFMVLSGAGRRAVDIEQFVVGCIKLKGWARSIDLMDLVHKHTQQASDLQVFCTEVSLRMKKLESLIAEVRSQSSCWGPSCADNLLVKDPTLDGKDSTNSDCYHLAQRGGVSRQATADPTIDGEHSSSTVRFSALGSESTLLLPSDFREDQGGNRLYL